VRLGAESARSVPAPMRSAASPTRTPKVTTRSVTDAVRSVTDSARSVTDAVRGVTDAVRSVTDTSFAGSNSKKSAGNQTIQANIAKILAANANWGVESGLFLKQVLSRLLKYLVPSQNLRTPQAGSGSRHSDPHKTGSEAFYPKRRFPKND
jgi:hypothetical protein